MEDSKGNLWIGNNCGNNTVGGIGVLRYDGKEFTHFTKQQGLRKISPKLALWTEFSPCVKTIWAIFGLERLSQVFGAMMGRP